MIEIEEALSRILPPCESVGTVSLPVIDAIGYVLAEDVVSDVDSPPHDKALVDGFAIRVADAGKQLRILEQVMAGGIPTKSIEPGSCVHVMTGAPVPSGVEAMVMVEDAEVLTDTVQLKTTAVRRGQFIMPAATCFARGDVVLGRGSAIRPIEVGLLCEVGRAEVLCQARPRVAVLPTGDELVACTQRPQAGEIRNSNGPMLEAMIRQLGCEVIGLGIGRDEESSLRQQIETGLEADILVLSGGVSAGVRDLVPPTLKSLGVEQVFHKVRLKPGKPIWFGCRKQAGRTTLVFGLPGNPVSSLVCFGLFVKPAIRRIAGFQPAPEAFPVRLAEPFAQRGNRPTYYPGASYAENNETWACPVRWHGSSDVRGVCMANCLIFFPAGEREYQAGEVLSALPLC